MSRAVMLWLAILLGVSGVTLLKIARDKSADASSRRSTVPAPPPHSASELLTEYTLTDQTGKQFGTADLKGQVHVVNFFFANCPSVCRVENLKVQSICREFAPQGVKFLSITCDPERDTPSALNQYASLFNANPKEWKFLTGDLLYIRRIGAEIYSVPVDHLTHTERIVVVDKWGTVRGLFKWDDAKEIAAMNTTLKELLAETSPPAKAEPAAPAGTDDVATDEDESDEAAAIEQESNEGESTNGSASADSPAGTNSDERQDNASASLPESGS